MTLFHILIVGCFLIPSVAVAAACHQNINFLCLLIAPGSSITKMFPQPNIYCFLKMISLVKSVLFNSGVSLMGAATSVVHLIIELGPLNYSLLVEYTGHNPKIYTPHNLGKGRETFSMPFEPLCKLHSTGEWEMLHWNKIIKNEFLLIYHLGSSHKSNKGLYAQENH